VSNTVTALPSGLFASSGNTTGLVDHALRLFNCWVAYDFHGPAQCDPGTYRPTLTFLCGKAQPFFCLEEILGSGVQQFVEFSMANWFFDADDNNEQMMAGFQVRAFDDRLFGQAMVTNGNETQTANLTMDNIP